MMIISRVFNCPNPVQTQGRKCIELWKKKIFSQNSASYLYDFISEMEDREMSLQKTHSTSIEVDFLLLISFWKAKKSFFPNQILLITLFNFPHSFVE